MLSISPIRSLDRDQYCDATCFAASNFPCFARAAVHRGQYKNGLGEINVSISIGGWVIEPGDIVVGDNDGIVTFSRASALIDAVRAQEAQEAEIMKTIQEGRYDGAYGRVSSPTSTP